MGKRKLNKLTGQAYFSPPSNLSSVVVHPKGMVVEVVDFNGEMKFESIYPSINLLFHNRSPNMLAHIKTRKLVGRL